MLLQPKLESNDSTKKPEVRARLRDCLSNNVSAMAISRFVAHTFACLNYLKLSEARKPSPGPREGVADFRGAMRLGNMSYRKVSFLRRC